MEPLIRSLAVAWKNVAAYPSGHPALVASVESAHRRLLELAASAGQVVLGISRDGLIFGEQKLASTHALELARALYRRNVALLRLERDVEASEIESLLRLLGRDLSGEEVCPLAEELASAGVRHIRLEAVDYSAVRATEELEPGPRPPATLWEDILQAVLMGRHLSADGRDLLSSEEAYSAAGIASLLERQLGAPPGGGTGGGGGGAARAEDLPAQLGKVVEGRLARLQGSTRTAAVHQVAELLRALPQELRESLLAGAARALATDEGGADALKLLSSSVSANAVLDALRRLNASGVKLSSHALRLVQALPPASKPAEPEGGAAEPGAEAILADLSSLFREEDIDRFNPHDHQGLLARVSIDLPPPCATAAEPPPALGDRLEGLADEIVSAQMAQTLGELLGRYGPREGFTHLLGRLEGLFRSFLTGGRLEPAASLVESLRTMAADPRYPQDFRARVQECLGHLASPESITALIDLLDHPQSAATAGLTQRLIDQLGAATPLSFLSALAEEADKTRRHRLLDLLASIGPPIVPEARRLLGDQRWYVVRNMLVLLRRVQDRSSLPEVRRCAAHPDLRVRLEAINSLLTFDPGHSRHLLEKAIHDPDPQMAEAAVALAGTYGIAEARDPLLGIVDNWDFFGRRRSLRLKALRALGDLADPASLPRLERFFKERWLPLVTPEERRAAFKSLEAYPVDWRRPLVERGLNSKDPLIRSICWRLFRLDSSGSSGP